MKYILLILVLSVNFSISQQNSGVVEISKLWENAFYIPGDNFTQEDYFQVKDDPRIQMMDSVYISIDKGDAVLITKNKSAEINNLSLDRRHLVIIKLNGKIISSFYFSFQNYKKNKLHLYYNYYSVWDFK